MDQIIKIPLESILKFGAKVELSDLRVVQVSGADAGAYLNSQTTNNVLSLLNNNFHFNSLLDITGRIISAFILLKESSQIFYLLVEKSNLEECVARLEKFHISEELEIKKLDLKPTLFLGVNLDASNSFAGNYILPNSVISFNPTLYKFEMINQNVFDEYRLCMGIPRIGKEVASGELINNTYFDELCVDYAKGCYPGQETVSKINTRRGAAYKPVLLKLNANADFVNKRFDFLGKKAGLIQGYVNDNYLYASLKRELRIDKKVIEIQIEDVNMSAQICYLPLLDLSPESLSEKFYDRALDYFHNEKIDSAIEDLKMAIKVWPKFEDAYESLGVVYGRIEKFDLAIDLMKKLKELNPKCMMAYTNLSLYHMKIGNIEEAEDFKSQATLLNFELLGDQAERKRQEDQRIEHQKSEANNKKRMFLAVLEIDQEDAMANNGMGEVLLLENDSEHAIPYFKKAIESNSKYSVAYLGLAKAYKDLNDHKSLMEILKRGIEVASKNGDLMPANAMQSMLLDLNE